MIQNVKDPLLYQPHTVATLSLSPPLDLHGGNRRLFTATSAHIAPDRGHRAPVAVAKALFRVAATKALFRVAGRRYCQSAAPLHVGSGGGKTK